MIHKVTISRFFKYSEKKQKADHRQTLTYLDIRDLETTGEWSKNPMWPGHQDNVSRSRVTHRSSLTFRSV